MPTAEVIFLPPYAQRIRCALGSRSSLNNNLSPDYMRLSFWRCWRILMLAVQLELSVLLVPLVLSVLLLLLVITAALVIVGVVMKVARELGDVAIVG